MALIPYNHPAPTPSLSSRNIFSIPSSYTSKSGTSTQSRPSSYTIRQQPPPPTTTHPNRHGRSAHPSSSSSSSSNTTSTSSAATSISSYTHTSTQTFGTYSRPGYAPGQAPHDYFYNEEVREEWDCAPLDGKGRRVRTGLRISGRGSSGSGSGGSGSGGWSGFGGAAPFSSSFFERGGSNGDGFAGMGGRRDSAFSGSERSGSWSGSGSLRYVDDGRGREEDWENDTVSPADSISQVSSSPSARRSGAERVQYPQSRYSGRPCGMEGGMRELGMGSVGGGSFSRNGDGVSMANGRMVRVEAPGWA
ncbi:hypothetical protein Q7P36_008680 [Cladosporium allicinum]